jgi:hypothetical protein
LPDFAFDSNETGSLKSLFFNKKIFCNSGTSAAFNTYMKDTIAGNSSHASGEYRIEISGWGGDNGFFVERANLIWRAGGEKQVHLFRVLRAGAMIFVRSISSDPSNLSVPVAYKVKTILPMDSQGRYPMNLVQMHPRSKESGESFISGIASNTQEARRQCETNDSEMTLEQEEILQ